MGRGNAGIVAVTREGGRGGGREGREACLGGASIIADTDDGDLAELDQANQLLHPASVLSTHAVHLVHNHDPLAVAGLGGQGARGGQGCVVQNVPEFFLEGAEGREGGREG